MFIPRLISSIIVLPAVIILTWLGGIYFVLLIAITTGIASYEISKMLHERKLISYPIISGILAFTYIILAHVLSGKMPIPIWIPFTFLFLGTISILYLTSANSSYKSYIQHPLSLITSSFFTAGFLGHAIFIRNGLNGLDWIILLIVIISLNDSGAFIFGKLIGNRPFFPSISPNKTFEGSISGIVLGTLGALIYKALTDMVEISFIHILILAIILTISGQIGDLFESGMKRMSKIKDSGNVIPGHGGVMDRLDSIVFTVAVLYHFIKWTVI